MRVFLIGATGFIGRSVAARLLKDGHQVCGLARTEKAASDLRRAGVEPQLIPGGFDDVASAAAVARGCDAVLDTAAHDFKKSARFMSGLRGLLSPGQVLISTTGVFFYGDVPDSKTRPVAEDQPYGFFPALAGPWQGFEASVLDGAAQGLLTCIVRPALVYGNGDGGLGQSIPFRMRAATARGSVWHVDDGRGGMMATVHVEDLADLYAIILSSLVSGKLPSGSTVNAGPGTISHEELAQGLAEACGHLSVVRMGALEAREKMKPADIYTETLVLGVDSSKAYGLGWRPSGTTLLEDLRAGSYTGLNVSKSKL